MSNLKISKEIYNLDTSELGDNLLYYSYHTRHLLSLIKQNVDKESPNYISAYNGFKGELFENIIGELLLKYAMSNPYITKFVLKGPHQNYKSSQNDKFGLLMDKNRQIVYKAGYKDISEYDAMFFTEDSIYFVESTIVVSTIGLRKRLRKKVALLSLLFPHLKVKALIILSEGATGLNRFPSYCTVWVTKPLDATEILDKLALGTKYKKQKFIQYKSDKFVHSHKIKVDYFKYFDTLGWIFRKSFKYKTKELNSEFFLSKKINRYFDIFSKIYIGFTSKKILEQLLSQYDFDISILEKDFVNDYVFVTIDKKDDDTFYLVYYAKEISGGLKKFDINNDRVKISTKDPKGFTVAETRFISHIIKPYNKLSYANLMDIKQIVEKW